jgi:hypothetical protein
LKWPEGQTPENCGITVYETESKEKEIKQ